MYATREPDYETTPVRASKIRSRERSGQRLQTPRSPVRRAGSSVRIQKRFEVASGAPLRAQPRVKVSPQGRKQARPSQAKSKSQRQVAELARETLLKLSVNTVLIGASAIALTHLVPTHLTQRNQLREVRSELTFTQTRVDKLRSDFSRTFDPMQAQSVMQQQTHLIDPNERPVFFTPKVATLEDSQP